MEIHLFTTDDIEQKLVAVENILTVLNYALQGLQSEYADQDLDSFETVIADAKQRIREICQSMQPISLDWDASKVMILCDCEVRER